MKIWLWMVSVGSSACPTCLRGMWVSCDITRKRIFWDMHRRTRYCRKLYCCGIKPLSFWAELGLKPLPRVFTLCWGAVRSSKKLACFVFPVVVPHSIACGIRRTTWIWWEHGPMQRSHKTAKSQDSKGDQESEILCLGILYPPIFTGWQWSCPF